MYFQSIKGQIQGLKYFPHEKADFIVKRLQGMLTSANASVPDSFTSLSKGIFIVCIPLVCKVKNPMQQGEHAHLGEWDVY